MVILQVKRIVSNIKLYKMNQLFQKYTLCVLVLFTLACGPQLFGQDGNGLYSGSDTIPNNTIATVEDNLGIGVVQNLNTATGTYFWLNRSSQRLDLVSQGLVTLGDPNLQGLFPTWLEVNSQSGNIRGYAKSDFLFQADTFFYSLRKGGLQLPNNLYGAPFLLGGDAGTLYFNRLDNSLLFWDGDKHRTVSFNDENKKDYVVHTTSAILSGSTVGIIYCKPTDATMDLILPPVSVAEGREFVIKNIHETTAIIITVNAGDSINGNLTTLTLMPNTGVRIHAISEGWYTLGNF